MRRQTRELSNVRAGPQTYWVDDAVMEPRIFVIAAKESGGLLVVRGGADAGLSKRAQILGMLVEGMSVRATSRLANRIQLTSEGYEVYLQAVEAAFLGWGSRTMSGRWRK